MVSLGRFEYKEEFFIKRTSFFFWPFINRTKWPPLNATLITLKIIFFRMDLTTTSLCVDDDVTESYECDVTQSYECDFCSKKFKVYSKLKRHLNKIHAARKKLKTKILKPKVLKQKFMCKKDRQQQRLLNVLKFERKVLKPVGQNGVRCYLCLKNYSSKETVDKHLVKFIDRVPYFYY